MIGGGSFLRSSGLKHCLTLDPVELGGKPLGCGVRLSCQTNEPADARHQDARAAAAPPARSLPWRASSLGRHEWMNGRICVGLWTTRVRTVIVFFLKAFSDLCWVPNICEKTCFCLKILQSVLLPSSVVLHASSFLSNVLRVLIRSCSWSGTPTHKSLWLELPTKSGTGREI